MEKILVFTATYNESQNIEALIKKIFSSNIKKMELLVIDDNSPDGTYKIIERLAKKNKKIHLIKRKKKLGLNTAHITGYNFAKRGKFNKFITLDADLSHNPLLIPKIIKLLDLYDFVIGSRYKHGGKNDMGIFRLILSILGNKLIRFIMQSKNTEFTTSFRGFNIKKLNKFNLSQIQSNGYSFFMETVLKIESLKFNSIEIPIHFKNRKYGKSKIPKIEIIRTLINLIRLFIKKLNEKI